MSASTRDTRPPADHHAAVEAALDRRVLDVLDAAWEMAKDRRLVAGAYVTRPSVQKIAAELAEPIGPALAADVIASLNARDTSGKAEAVALLGEAVDHVWDVIA